MLFMAHRKTQSQVESGSQELRRGAVVLAILAQLRTEHYGYSLREKLAAGGLPVNEGTLYPLLRRLEAQGLLSSDWDLGAGRPRRYYRISRNGRRALADLTAEWQALVEVMERMLAPEGEE
jgi:DNA-binding PadR family transcriptional regulator